MNLQRPKTTADEAMNTTARAMRVKDTIAKETVPLSFAKGLVPIVAFVMNLTETLGQVIR